MCFQEQRTFACGHIGHTTTFCPELTNPPTTSPCSQLTIISTNDVQYCGIGGFYCRSDIAGARIEQVYEAVDITKAVHDHVTTRLLDIQKLHNRIQEHYKASDKSTPSEALSEAMDQAMLSFKDLLNQEVTTKWQLTQLEKKVDAAKEYYTIATVHPLNSGGVMPALIFPTLDPQPPKIAKLPPGAGMLTKGKPKPLPIDDTGQYIPPVARMTQPKPATKPSKSMAPPETPRLRTFKNPPTAYLTQCPVNPETGDRSTWIKQMAQDEMERSHKNARLQGVQVPTSPVKARRVMQRDGPRPSRARKPRGGQEVVQTPTRASRRQPKVDHTETTSQDDVATDCDDEDDVFDNFEETEGDITGDNLHASYDVHNQESAETNHYSDEPVQHHQNTYINGSSTDSYVTAPSPSTMQGQWPQYYHSFQPQTQYGVHPGYDYNQTYQQHAPPELNIESWNGNNMLPRYVQHDATGQSAKRSLPTQHDVYDGAKRARLQQESDHDANFIV